MCGIVGFVANARNGFAANQVAAFREMLYIDALRGVDSTGLFYITNSGDVQIHKDTNESSVFLKSDEWESTDKELFSRGLAVVGHCRAATRGLKKDENAHPFNVDNKIILVHNGTYVGSHHHIKAVEVDSHAITHALAEEDNIETALKKINAAYALVWYNTETKKLNIIRNKERPLYIGVLEDDSMIFASEAAFIYLACWRNNLKLKKDQPSLLEEDCLLEVDLNDISKPYKYTNLDCKFKYNTPVNNVYTPPFPIATTSFNNRSINWNSRTRVTMIEAANLLGVGDYIPYKGSKQFRDLAQNGEELSIEAFDYCSSDDAAPNNNLWYVFGRVLSKDLELNGKIVAWDCLGDSEEDIKRYQNKGYFRGKVEFVLIKSWPQSVVEAQTALFKMCDVTPLETCPVDLITSH